MNPFRVVEDFERGLCEYTGAPYAVAVNSCTMALTLALLWHFQRARWLAMEGDRLAFFMAQPFEVEIPKRTYVGVPYAIREVGCRPTFREENWRGLYQLRPFPIWDAARLFTAGMYRGGMRAVLDYGAEMIDHADAMLCVSFHWAKTLGIQQGGAVLHDNPEADEWLRRARFDGRAERVHPSVDTFPLRRAFHCYMSPEIAAAGLVRLAKLPRNNEPLPWGPGTDSDYPDLAKLEVFQHG